MIRDFWSCIYHFTLKDQSGEVVDRWSIKNALVDEGAEVAIETFLRNNAALYIPDGNLYLGLYFGTMSRATTILTIPNEVFGNGYTRQIVQRSATGWPTKDVDEDGFWNLTSRTVQFDAVGGDIGPFNGAFLVTSSDSSGRLISYVTDQFRRTILDGSSITVALSVRCR